MNPVFPFPRLVVGFIACLLLAFPLHGASDLRTLGLKGDGVTDDTAALQAALEGGNRELVFPPGTYLLGTVDVPSDVVLRGEAGARLRINPEAIRTYSGEAASKTNFRCVFALKGDRITLRDLEFDFTLTEADDVAADRRPGALVVAEKHSVLRLIGLRAERPEPVRPLPVAERKRERYARGAAPANKRSFHLALMRYSQDIVMDGCRGAFLANMLDLYHCTRVWSLNNRCVHSNAITCSRGGEEFLWHMGNWSSGVRHQCRFWGGNSNDTRRLKPDSPGRDTATIVRRGSRDGDADYNRFTVGAFDIFIVNNYGEYGRTLAWGSKGRHVFFRGNIGRFTNDYVLGVEGCEEAIFDGNIVVNGNTCGLAAYYWSEKVVMTGNLVLVKDEPIDMEQSWFPTPEGYQGGLIRLHAAGPSHKSGTGQAVIRGNLLISELTDRPRGIRIEAGRDVLITGNKIVNGAIFTKGGSGQVTIADNDFTMTLSAMRPWITLAPAMKHAVIRGNTFRSTVSPERRSPTEMLIRAEADGHRRGPVLRVIEDNLMQGFPLAIWARALSRGPQPDAFLIRENQLDGLIRYEGLESAARFRVADNIDLNRMRKAEPEILNQQPEPLPEPVPSPEDEAAAISDGTAGEPDQENE